MDPDSRKNLLGIKLIAINFLFLASIYTGKSILYLLVDFALFAFVATLIYVNAVALIERKRLVEPEEPVEYLTKEEISASVGNLLGVVNQFVSLVLTGTIQQNLAVNY
jgi:hypothetical protein